MPGLKKKITADEFFRTLASYIRALAEKTGRIGFCFSYPTDILPDRDGRLIHLTKEIKAPELVGKLIGRSLLEVLGTPGKHLVLLNDTVSTLLAGKSASLTRSFDSFIGFILGTGTNTAYIEKNKEILKNRDLNPGRSQIINIESGNFSKAARTDLDKVFDNTTTDPGKYTFEKMFSGRYIGGLCLTILRAAASEGVFSPGSSGAISRLTGLSSNDVNLFVSGRGKEKNVLSDCFPDHRNRETGLQITNTVIGRAAKLAAGNLSAVILKTGKGRSPESPVLITIEGSVFYKLHNLRSGFETCLKEYLDGDNKRYYEFIEVQHSSLIGAALAALIGEQADQGK
jgi:hexokinase